MRTTFIHCYINGCRYNADRTCTRHLISIGLKASSEFCCGDRVHYPVCEDYEEIERMEDME